MITVSTPRSRAMSSTTAFAFEEVQQTSLSAFTSAEVFHIGHNRQPRIFLFEEGAHRRR